MTFSHKAWLHLLVSWESNTFPCSSSGRVHRACPGPCPSLLWRNVVYLYWAAGLVAILSSERQAEDTERINNSLLWGQKPARCFCAHPALGPHAPSCPGMEIALLPEPQVLLTFGFMQLTELTTSYQEQLKSGEKGIEQSADVVCSQLGKPQLQSAIFLSF